jgi:hypothetical protein
MVAPAQELGRDGKPDAAIGTGDHPGLWHVRSPKDGLEVWLCRSYFQIDRPIPNRWKRPSP